MKIPFIDTAKLLVLTLLASIIPAGLAQQDFSKVEIKTIHVAKNVYMLQGSGGNIGASVGDDGTLIVDDQFAPLAGRILDALKQLNPNKPRFLVNTHHHGDHTGGNFPQDLCDVGHPLFIISPCLKGESNVWQQRPLVSFQTYFFRPIVPARSRQLQPNRPLFRQQKCTTKRLWPSTE